MSNLKEVFKKFIQTKAELLEAFGESCVHGETSISDFSDETWCCKYPYIYRIDSRGHEVGEIKYSNSLGESDGLYMFIEEDGETYMVFSSEKNIEEYDDFLSLTNKVK